MICFYIRIAFYENTFFLRNIIYGKSIRLFMTLFNCLCFIQLMFIINVYQCLIQLFMFYNVKHKINSLYFIMLNKYYVYVL